MQGAAIFIYSCTLHHKIQSENQHLTTKRKAQVQTLFCSSYFFHTLLIFPSYRKTKNLLFFSFFSQNYYICTSSKSRAKQCSETRTATKSLPVTELPTLYVLSIKLLKEIYRFFLKNWKIWKTRYWWWLTPPKATPRTWWRTSNPRGDSRPDRWQGQSLRISSCG